MKSKYVNRLGIFIAASLFAVSVSTTVPAESEPGEKTVLETQEETVVLVTSPGEVREDDADEAASGGDKFVEAAAQSGDEPGRTAGPVRLIGNAGGNDDTDAVFTDELLVRTTTVAPPDDADAILPTGAAETATEPAAIEEETAREAADPAVRSDVEVLVPETRYAQSGPTVLVGDAGTSVTRTPTPAVTSSAPTVSTRTSADSGSQTAGGSAGTSSGSQTAAGSTGTSSGDSGSTASSSGTGGSRSIPVRTASAATRNASPKTGDVSTPLFYIGMMSCSLTAMIDQTFKFRQRRKK